MAFTHSVVAFSGHMVDAPGRPEPRFPPSRVDYVRARIEERLAERADALAGVCSAADGSDLLFAEAVLARGGELTIFLPFPPRDFQQTSVKPEWRVRFEQVLASPRAHVRPPLYPSLPSAQAEQNRAFAEVNDAIIATAESLAERLGDPDPWFLAVYHDAQKNKTGGTGDAFAGWVQKGRRLLVIDPAG